MFPLFDHSEPLFDSFDLLVLTLGNPVLAIG
jgi:hypothetical protein